MDVLATTDDATRSTPSATVAPPSAATSVLARKHTEMMEACASGDLDAVRRLLLLDEAQPQPSEHEHARPQLLAALQDETTGQSPLMVASRRGHSSICAILLEAGAPWNAVDRCGRCAGNFATDAEHWETVNLLVEYGTRAEMILGASHRFAVALQGKIGGEGDAAEGARSGGDDSPAEDSCETKQHSKGAKVDEDEGGSGRNDSPESTAVKRPVSHEPSMKPDYLDHNVRYNAEDTLLLDDDGDAVMMEWERPIMNAHASIVTLDGQKSRRVLNVGFGLGIIDSALQNYEPELHVIIEAHPKVYEKMCKDGWDKKRGVRICFGRWQDELPKLIAEGLTVDGIFYDTYGEDSFGMEDFHELMVKILSKTDGVYSFFNGLAPDNLFFHGVACNCVKLQLAELGLETEFAQCKIQHVNEKDWEGVRRPYWHGRTDYYLPIATWKK